MSEMLAAEGRIGAEEVRDVVNRTFEGLLDLASSHGASLLKFGGDALLLLFAGRGADVAAVRSAWGMRERLLAANPVTTIAGPVDLSMTIGVHTGPVDLFLVGDLHRELIVAGPSATAVIETEGAADRGQILLSADLRADWPGFEVAERADGRRELLGIAVADSTARPPQPAPDLANGHQVLSRPVAARVAEDRGGEHRQATIGFVHFDGTDRILETEGPAALAAALRELTEVVQQAAEAWDVCFLSSDIDADGGKIILTAGVPSAGEDDDDRMVNACRAVTRAGTRLPVRIGVNRGPVFAGVVGPPYRLTYTVLGDAVNLAARLMSRASPGQVLVEAGVLNRCRALYDVEVLEPFHVKGKQAAVRAVAVGDEIGVRIRIRTDTTGFVGREDELGRLVDLADGTVRDGTGRAVCLTGPPGIGKSRLIDELQERRPDLPLQLIACSRFGTERPYRAVQMLLRLVLTGQRHGPPSTLLRATRDLVGDDPEIAPWLPLLADVFDVDIPPTPETSALAPSFRAPQTRHTIGLLLHRALAGPTILVVEDLQWLDPESRDVLLHEGRHLLVDHPWLVIGTSRDPAAMVEGMRELALGPLSEAASRELTLAAVDRGEVPVERATTLVRRSGGNPLFLIELIRTAAGNEMPDSLESLFQQRLDGLPARQRRLLRHAAVLGLEFPVELLEALSETAEDIDLDDLPELGEFVTQMRSGYWRFTQSLHQEVAYGSLPFRTRRTLHGRAARAMEAIQRDGGIIAIEALSRHHHLAGEYDRSWRSSRQAFAVARGRSAVETAARFAKRAIEAGRRAGAPAAELARVWEGLGDMLELSGAYAAAEDAYRATRRVAPQDAESRLCRKVGHVKERTGDYTQALRWYSMATKAATNDHDHDVALVRRAVTLMRQGRREQAIALADDLLGRTLQDVDRAHALWIRGWAATELQDPAGGAALDEAAQLFGRVEDWGMQAVVLLASGADAYYRGAWTAAVERYRQARDLWDRVGDRGNRSIADLNIGEVLGDQGHFEQAREAAVAAHQFGRATRNEIVRLFSALLLGRVEARAGNHDAAVWWYVDLQHEAAKARARGYLVRADLGLAEVAWFAGRDDDAERHLADTSVVRAEPEPAVAAWQLRLEGLLALRSDPATCRAQLEESVRVAQAGALRYEAWLSLAALDALELGEHGPFVAREAEDLGIVVPPEVLSIGGRR